MQVDVDLGREGDASRVSRHQARVALRPDGAFAVTNCGRRKLHINGCQVRVIKLCHPHAHLLLASGQGWPLAGAIPAKPQTLVFAKDTKDTRLAGLMQRRLHVHFAGA